VILRFVPGGKVGVPDWVRFELLSDAESPWAFQPLINFKWRSYFGAYQVKLHASEDTKYCPWPLPRLPVSRRDAGEEGKLSRLDSWLRNCQETHETCQSYGGSKEGRDSLPKRVLDVSPPKGQLRLYEPHNEPHNEKSQYICLSHRWGESQPLSTTRENIEDLKRNIEWGAIPQLFKDAITVARRLGVRYLWIDSLCIVQDDRQDWEEQAPLMCDIYSNAILTIFATRCEDCLDTLFPSFDRTIHGYDEKGNPLAVAVRIECLHLDPEHSDYPLLTRAWVFQERLLSRGVVHFGYDELFWECMDATSCECSEEIIRGPLEIKSIRYRDPYQATQKDYQRVWHEIVAQYTALKLTYRSDRQPALQGLATQMANTRRGRYLAGLWEDSLITDLAWRRVASYGTREKGAHATGPSWSWASIDAQCEQSSHWVDDDTSILEIQTPRPSIGEQVHICLTLRGRLVSGVSNNNNTDTVVRARPEHKWFRRSFDLGEGARAFFYPDVAREPFLPDGESIFCLALGFSANETQTFETGLVLQCVDAKEQLYERIGIADLERTGQRKIVGIADRFFAAHKLVTVRLV